MELHQVSKKIALSAKYEDWGLESVVEKNVKFTPKNIIQNLIFNHFGFIDSPVNREYRWRNPAINANTAPKVITIQFLLILTTSFNIMN